MNTGIEYASIGIVAITYYPNWYKGKLRSIKHTDKIRGDLALEFLQKASASGYSIVVCDGMSTSAFKQTMKAIEGITIVYSRTHKRAPKRRKALNTLTRNQRVKVIVFTELEKIALIDAIPLIAAPILEGKADIVIPKREDTLFKVTYPSFQYESEVEGNAIYNENLKKYGLLRGNAEELDVFFGPRVIKNTKDIARVFNKKYKISVKNLVFPTNYFDPEEYSNSLFFPIIDALKRKCKVSSVTVPFTYPLLQKKNEEANKDNQFMQKRESQRISILLDLLYFLKKSYNKIKH